MKSTWKKLMSALLVLAMLIGVLAVSGQKAEAAGELGVMLGNLARFHTLYIRNVQPIKTKSFSVGYSEHPSFVLGNGWIHTYGV